MASSSPYRTQRSLGARVEVRISHASKVTSEELVLEEVVVDASVVVDGFVSVVVDHGSVVVVAAIPPELGWDTGSATTCASKIVAAIVVDAAL